MDEQRRFFRGVGFGLLLSIPIWLAFGWLIMRIA
jgi:hypothetical protein